MSSVTFFSTEPEHGGSLTSAVPGRPPGIERRANAFAAYLLMPRDLIMRHLGYDNRLDTEEIWRLAGILHVNESPLVEHLYNIDLIDEFERDRLRTSIRRRQ